MRQSWLAAFAYGWEHVVINDETAEGIIDGLADRVWPPKEGFLEALEKASFEDEETKELLIMMARDELGLS